MDIREVGMLMGHRHMDMPMAMRLAWRIARPMHVLMVLIVHVAMFMCHGLVGVFMLVILRNMQAYADSH